MSIEKRLLKINKEDKHLDVVLRPVSWADYVGQEKIKKGLRMILGAANKRNESSDHLLFCGQPGLGKTTLAYLTAKEMGGGFKTVSAPSVERIGDLAAVLSNLESRDILFIDEAHRLKSHLEEALYSAIDAGKIYIPIGKGSSSRVISLDLPPFTLIAATTRVNLISAPLRSRFGAIFRLDYYEIDDISAIIRRSAEILGIKIAPAAVLLIAKASHFTPRMANRLLKRSRDFAEMNNFKTIDEEVVLETFDVLEIDELGLESHDRRLLEIIVKKFRGGPVGIGALSSALGEEREAIENIYEPYLLKIGFLYRTPKGRMVSQEAKEWLENKSR